VRAAAQLFAEVVVIVEVSHDQLLIFPMPAAMADTANLLGSCSVLSRLNHHALKDAG
jgi:hypothetical protein